MKSLLPLLLCVAFAGCHRTATNEQAVRQAVIDYLSGRPGLNVASMDVSVVSMIERQDQVDATVSFAPKGAAPAQGMTMHYLLERKGGRWVVKPHANAGQNPHGDMGANPQGTIPMPGMGTPPPGGALPPGHPAVPPSGSSPK